MRKLISDFLYAFDFNAPGLAVLKLPTGYGKTELFMELAKRTCMGKIARAIYASPLRALNEDLYYKLEERGYCVVHQRARQYMERSESPFFHRKVVVTTIDTLGFSVYKVPTAEMSDIVEGYVMKDERTRGHFSIPRANISDSVVLIDEPHLAFTESGLERLLLGILQYLLASKATVILASATLTDLMLRKIDYIKRRVEDKIGVKLQYEKCIYAKECSFSSNTRDEEFDQVQAKKNVEMEIHTSKQLIDKVLELIASRDATRKLIVLNSPREAIKVYRKIQEQNIEGTGEVFMLHGLLSRNDREETTRKLLENKNKPFTLVATQVVEAGLDVSADLLITDLAPIQSLVQRMGRVSRWDQDESGRIEIVVDEHKMNNSEDYGPYGKDLVDSALKALSEIKGSLKPKIPASMEGFKGYMDLVDYAESILAPRYEEPALSLGKLLSLSSEPQEQIVFDFLSGRIGRNAVTIQGFILDADGSKVVENKNVEPGQLESMDKLMLPVWLLERLLDSDDGKSITVIVEEKGSIVIREKGLDKLRDIIRRSKKGGAGTHKHYDVFKLNYSLINENIKGVLVPRSLYNKIAREGVDYGE
ncbi:CRISPR-associated helicase Cas3' [Desulfurococcus mucosus]|uniref:CRISPR-associated helicase Cas3 n=1 Tax=Desulfurococcus mucosus (strain ATCC 35584 / DSM 2162 / JCM 9187 / O7/1) TaxID=765177 RepID=E8R9X3_DESM0|nr:CRISPR-associated helicase Cas3' [Desulfurococcus mucosus]ADV65299.1 CRISPR-associated helicase Cas3 [Desulfurococcus mucosus DSM 2162]